jgi:membrane protein implicated in regulation of membrane protease activity
MNDYWVWWILATLLVGAELLTGTFYLLAVGIAFAFGGLAAWLGAPLALQMITAGVLAVIGTILANRWRRKSGDTPALPDLDIGQSVRVEAWQPDGTARVVYRGTRWNGVLRSAATPRRDTMYIVATRGSTLVLDAARP